MSIVAGRRSSIYNITTDQLRMYFESPGVDIRELKARIRDCHKKKLKLVVVTSVIFHIYRRCESESDIEEDGHDGHVVYPEDDQQPLSATLEMSTKDLFNDNDGKSVALPVDLLTCNIDSAIKDNIAVKIRKLVRELQDEYTKWKQGNQPPPPSPHSAPFDENPKIPLRKHEKLRPSAARPSGSYEEPSLGKRSRTDGTEPPLKKRGARPGAI